MHQREQGSLEERRYSNDTVKVSAELDHNGREGREERQDEEDVEGVARCVFHDSPQCLALS